MYKVMVVDDEKLVRQGIVMGTDWKSLDCVVAAEAANGMEALENAEKFHPELIICDIRMPGMDGIEMLEELRRRGSDASVIYLTAYGEFSYAQAACRLTASDYLLKPFEDGELEEAVRRALAKRKARKEQPSAAPSGLELTEGEVNKYVAEAISYIGSHYHEQTLSLGEIAAHLGLSEGHLSHTFKKETSFTVAAYITRIRMREAMKLLSDCSARVYEVAEQVGYRDIAHFSNTFKKNVGLTPSEYQNRSK